MLRYWLICLSLAAPLVAAPGLYIETMMRIRRVSDPQLSPDGKMDNTTVYFDGAAFARQVGMLPPAGSAGDRVVTTAFNGLTRLRRRIKGS